MIDIDEYQTFLSDTKATLKFLNEDKDKTLGYIEEMKSSIGVIAESQTIMSALGIVLQEDIKKVFEELVTQSLQAIFGSEYTFELESRIARGKPEIELFIVENGVRYSPRYEKGGGIIDVVAFSLRIVSWAIREPRSQNVMILDEPFRCMHKEVLSFLSEMMQKISSELGLQIICITHENQIAIVAEFSDNNKAFYVRQVDGISEVVETKRAIV